jgi:hypothetical protein
MIPDRLPWRHRARPSATLHEIQVHSTIKIEEWTCCYDATKCRRPRQGESQLQEISCRVGRTLLSADFDFELDGRGGPHSDSGFDSATSNEGDPPLRSLQGWDKADD